MAGNDLTATADHHTVKVPAHLHVVVSVGRWHRVFITAVTHQRQGIDPGRVLLTGIKCNIGQCHERRAVFLEALAYAGFVAAQHRYLALVAGCHQFGVELIDAVHPWQRHHEVAPGIAHQALDLAFVIALGWPAKTVFKEVVTLQFAKCLGGVAS